MQPRLQKQRPDKYYYAQPLSPESLIFYLYCNFYCFCPYYLQSLTFIYQPGTNNCMTEREYNQCVDMYADNVYRFILKNLGHEADAKDVVQGAFEKMWVNRQQVDNERCKSFLFTVAYHQMIDHIRKNKRTVLKDAFSENAKTSNRQQHDSKKVLNEALNRLNETQRSLVMLKDYEGYSYGEIGEITGLNESQVKVYLHRARLQLREYIVRPENVI
jgi:RNA polymerase sigma factor (sigma-70 family)